MQKIYKYTSISSAILVLKNKSILLNNPNNFNDPYDCEYNYENEDFERTKKIYLDYLVIDAMSKIGNKVLSNLKGIDRVAVNNFNKSLDLTKKALQVHPFYEGTPLCSTVLNLLYKKLPSIGKEIDEKLNNLKQVLDKTINGFRDEALVSCFSEKKDSILMWSHYASSHRGVCLEFDFPEEVAFQKVIYSKKVPEIKIYKLMSHIFALRILGKEVKQLDTSLNFNETLAPFYTKSKEWSYEKEVRCLYSKKEINDKIYLNDQGKYELKMNYPTVIYIGDKANDNELNDLIILANNRQIPIHFMKKDNKTFSIIEDKLKKYDTKQKECVKEITLLRLYNDINVCLNNGAYLAALATSLIIPAICSQLEIKGEMTPKERYIKWCNEYFACSQRNPESKLPYLSGEICWELKEQLFLNGNIDIKGEYEDFYLNRIILLIERRNHKDIYTDVIDKNTIKQNVLRFCTSLLAQVDRCVEKYKDEIENLTQIEIEDYDKKIEEIKESKIKSNK